MKYMQETYPSEINIINVIPHIRRFEASLDEIESGGESELFWEVLNAESISLAGETVDNIGSKIIAPTVTAQFELIATGIEGDKDTSYVTVKVLPEGLINRALNKPSRASTFETCCGADRISSRAFDGDSQTRWSSAWSNGSGQTEADTNIDADPDSEWIDVDLGAAHEVSSVLFDWAATYSTNYDIQISLDGINWNTVFSETASDGGIDSVVFETKKLGRFVRMQGNARSLEFGHSMWEFEVRGTVSLKQPPTVMITCPKNDQRVLAGSSLIVNVDATDSDGDIEFVSFFMDGDSLGIDSSTPFLLSIPSIPEGEHFIYVKAVDDDGFVVQTEPITINGRTDIFTIRLEAEDATLKGATKVQPGRAGASKGASVFMEGSGSITWDNLIIPDGDSYKMDVRYYLPFDYKEQELFLNGVLADTLIFETPIGIWQDLSTSINSNGKIRSIRIDHYWGYMEFDYIDLTVEGVIIDNEHEIEIPSRVSLKQNYPNPFNPSTNIEYAIPDRLHVVLKIYNSLGQEVATLVNDRQSPGNYIATWDATSASSGVYFYKMLAGFEIYTKKMILIK